MKKLIVGLLAAACASTALPAAAHGWGGDYWRSRSGYGFQDYPEFRGLIDHIQGEIRQGTNEGWLDYGQAHQLRWRLQQVRWTEAREFRYHGWNLPDYDRQAISNNLDQLDRWVDQLRDQSDSSDDGDQWSNGD